MENEDKREEKIPTAEELVGGNSDLTERKSKFKNFFLGWIKDNYDKTLLIVIAAA